MPPRTFVVAPGHVLHINVPGKGRHVAVVIDRGPRGEAVFAVATSGNWKTEPLRREINFSTEPARSWITDWPKDNREISYFYGDFIEVYPPEAWIRVTGEVPPSAIDALVDLFGGWDARRRGAPIPAGPIPIPPPASSAAGTGP